MSTRQEKSIFGLPLSRRSFILGVTVAGGGLALGAKGILSRLGRGGDMPEVVTDPTVFLRIGADNSVTLLSKHLEMGQGVMTGLATIVAEELDADWGQMRVEHAPANRALYQNLIWGRQVTAASSSMANSWLQMRRVGAAARHMLVSAAANRWQVPAEAITVAGGVVRHPETDRQATFGDLAAEAIQLPVPDPEVLRLKEPSEWSLIGQSLKRVDVSAKVEGEATFGLDVRRPGMVRAVIARAPRFGGVVESYDAEETLSIPGVVEVVEIPMGVAVLAEDTWTAIRGRDALRIEWDDSSAETRSTEEIFDDYRRLAEEDGVVARERGDADAALAGAEHLLDFEFTVPYLAHAPMEPLNCVMERTATGVEVWSSGQVQTLEQRAVAEVLGLDPEQVKINSVFAGSSFGRRVYSNTDWMFELAHLVKESQLDRPIQLVWTREDDIRGGVYRPMALHRGTAGLNADGDVVGWRHLVVCESLVEGTPWTYAGVDRGSVGALVETSYALPNVHVAAHSPSSPIPMGFWRSVGDGHTGFVLETVMDELAHAAGRDPLEFRLSHLSDDPLQRRVLEVAAREAGWGESLPAGRGRGIAGLFDAIFEHRTYVAMVTDLTVDERGFRVDRVVCALDCGVVINPQIVEAQVESAISFALSTTLGSEITLERGFVQQSNFHDYQVTRMSDMPDVEVHLLSDGRSPSGVGEAAVAPLAPSVGNALFDATGRRIRQLPFRV
ncbi:MAG: xanthine dehydrogenase family protein molybdopterin-binding subunit [Gemmatimonadetes bacterium]|nr:xanthine dehydrogenase family protein molybdopterin-binding subunit [Gemmatimonadota bacterium]